MILNAQTDVVQGIITQVKSEFASDTRTVVYAIASEWDEDSTAVLKGDCSDRQAVEALLGALGRAGIAYRNEIRLLPDSTVDNTHWGLVTVCCAHLRSEARHASEMVSQAILGTPLRLLEKRGDWYRVQTPDRYISWIAANSITVQSEERQNRWRESPRYIYTAQQGLVYAIASDQEVVSDIVIGSILQGDGTASKGFIPVRFPDGRTGFIKKSECDEFSTWASQPFDIERVIQTARHMMGTTYLWGGTSVKSADCSGFVKTAYFTSGVILSRDASQQALTGEAIPADRWSDCETGDLLFFGNDKGRVNHVALYLNNGKYIHSSGQVKINSLDTLATDYLPGRLLGINRVKSRINTPGIVATRQHPWYFNQ